MNNNWVRLPANRDDKLTLKPGVDFRDPNQRSPWDRPTPEEVQAGRELSQSLFAAAAQAQQDCRLGQQQGLGPPQMLSGILGGFPFGR